MKVKKRYLLFAISIMLVGIPIICAKEIDGLQYINTLYSTVTCGDAMEIPASIPKFSSSLITTAKYLIPVVLIILGMIDFFRASFLSKESEMKLAPTRFIRRIIGGVAVFLVVAFVQFVFNTLETDNDPLQCLQCFVSNQCNK